jgi:transposase InsO family protein
VTPNSLHKWAQQLEAAAVAQRNEKGEMLEEEVRRLKKEVITYLWTREGWLYLATVIDLYSRKVVGWALRDRMTVDLVSEALDKAVERRRPNVGVLFHSDRGSQYASHRFREQLERLGMVQSMSRVRERLRALDDKLG